MLDDRRGAPLGVVLSAANRTDMQLAAAVLDVTGMTPALSTGGGTSDGRFLTAVAREIVEFGPTNDTIHKIDERVKIADLAPLSRIYERTLLTLTKGALGK